MASRNIDESANWKKWATEALAIERDAVWEARAAIDENFVAATRLLRDLPGKIVCCGVGKSGHIARKIASTFSSTGAPALFVHPTEAGHGDLGALAAGDCALLISYSGENAETLQLLPALRQLQIPLMALVGKADSTLAKSVDIALVAAVKKEACPHNLAPTASATAALALGDALAMTLLRARGFSPDDFARSHPAGSLGRRLLLRVSDIMRAGDAAPRARLGCSFADALLEMTGKQMGMTLVVDDDDILRGIFTDGDLRRLINARGGDLANIKGIAEVMSKNPRRVGAKLLAAEALQLMRKESLNHLPVTDDAGKLLGALSFHDLLRHKIL